LQSKNFQLFFLVFFLAGIYFFIFSSSGLLERIELGKKSQQLGNDISLLRNKLTLLNKKLEKYKFGYIKDDNLLNSGFIPKNSKLLFIRGNHKLKKTEISKKAIYKKNMSIYFLRIIWLLISFLLVLFFLIKVNNKQEDVE